MNKNTPVIRLAVCIIGFLSLNAFSSFAQISAPVSCTAAIGNPANGASHYITVSWTAVSGATSYQLQYSTDGSTWNNLSSGSPTTYNNNTGSIGNLPYYYRVNATNGTTTSAYTNCAQFPIYSACNDTVPILSNVTSNSIGAAIRTAAPDSNATGTTYAIYCTTTSQYVQANGTLGAGAVYQSKATWGQIITVTGLTVSTNYCFYVAAKNNDGDVRTQTGVSILPVEPFTTNGNLNSASCSGPTNKYWIPPSACNGGNPVLTYQASGGCTGGQVGFSGSFNNYFGSFIRTPQVNCSGNTSVVLNFDLSNSYIASHINGSGNSNTNDHMRIYMWDNHFSSGNYYYYATSIKINGVEVSHTDGNGVWVEFDQLRTCVNVEATFDFSTDGVASGDIDKLLFYLEPSCEYNDSYAYSVGIDNINIKGGTGSATVCATTTSCAAVTIQNNPSSQGVCENGNQSFSITTNGSPATYQWQVSTNNGSSWANINNGGVYSNATTTTLNLTGVTAAMNNYEYRCVVTGTCSGNPTSNAAALTVNTVPTITGTIDGDVTACSGTLNTYSIATAAGATSYTWSLPSGWAGTSNTVTIGATVDTSSGQISVTANNTCGSSSPVTLNVTVVPKPIAGIISTPKDTICAGTVAHLTLEGSSGGTIQWQSSATPNNFTNINGVTSTAYNPILNQTTYYKVVVNSANCADVTPTFEMATYPAPFAVFTFSIRGDTVFFNSTGTTGAISYTWAFGDDSISTNPNPFHIYSSTDTFHVCLTIKNNTNCNYTTCLNVTGLLTGVNDVSANSNWQVYPNPFSNYIILHYNKATENTIAVIRDVLGREVARMNISVGTTEARMEMPENTAKGIYFLNLISSDGKTETRKMLRD